MIAFRCPRCDRLHVEIEDDISPYTEYICDGCGKKFLVNTCIIKDSIAETIPVTEPLEAKYFNTDDYESDYSKMISCDDTVPMKKKEKVFTEEVEKLLKDNDIEIKEMSEEQKKHLDELLESSAMCFNNVENKIESWQNHSVLNIQFEEIHLTKDKVDITINNERVKHFDSITIDGIKFVREK